MVQITQYTISFPGKSKTTKLPKCIFRCGKNFMLLFLYYGAYYIGNTYALIGGANQSTRICTLLYHSLPDSIT